ncbi:MAG: DinB family protein [Candidatus Hydrogenedentes bacterium]|nr:DinB family protein [Candidatus Hydrogenedentota bacterium]
MGRSGTGVGIWKAINDMKDIEPILGCLEKTPRILTELLSQIPAQSLKVRRAANSWSIHEHACHIATGDRIGFIHRLRQFVNEEFPIFVPLSGETFRPDHLMNMSLESALDAFFKDRAEVIRLIKSLDPTLWDKKGAHPEYIAFTPYIMLRHRLMHDHLHMYRIEALWLTTEQRLGIKERRGSD